LTEERVANHFKALKTQSYYDPSSRGPGSHSYVSSKVFGLSPIRISLSPGKCQAITTYATRLLRTRFKAPLIV
jgi:hypothetical protein